jgi:LPS sulfotransferase NodH
VTDPVRPLILVGAPRTGSTLLTTMLLQHPDIHVHGELFHPEMSERQRSHAMRGRTKAWFDADVDDPIDFLTNQVFGVDHDYQGRKVSTVGFKFLLSRRCTQDLELLHRIRESFPTLAVLHIRRENYLDSLLSREFAERGKQWVAWSHLQEPRGEISEFSVPLQRARQHFEGYLDVDSILIEEFAGISYRSIFYEDLVEHLDPVMASVFNFLGVAQRDVGMVTDKQVAAHDLALVRNLAQLRAEYAAFCATANAPRRRPAVEVVATPHESAIATKLADLDPAMLRKLLVLASRGLSPARISRRLQAAGFDIDIALCRRTLRRLVVDTPAWLSRALPEGLAGVFFLAVRSAAGTTVSEELPARPVVGIGVSASGRRMVLGVWGDPSDIDIARRGLRRTLLMAGDAQSLETAHLQADARLPSIFTSMEESLHGLRGQGLQEASAALGAALHQDERLVELPVTLRSALLPALRLEQIRRGLHAAGASRSPLEPEQILGRLRLFARSLDPMARDDTPWRPWSPSDSAMATLRLTQPFAVD